MYKKIKKQNGEKFAKTIRDYDNGIFDIPNVDKIVKYAGDDAEPLLQYLTSLKNVKIEDKKETVFFGDLLEQAGYNWIIADTKEKQDSIKKYYAKKEVICTIGTERYKNYHIVHCWRKDIADIKRKNFTNPKREDEYGTSCMSIQMSKKGGFISIKNRYNHIVPNCDNTLNSNPDNIIAGLGQALKEYFKVDFTSQKVDIKGNYHIFKNMIIKYNYEINGCFIGKDFYIKNGDMVEINKDYEIIADYFLLNVKENSIKIIPDTNDSFLEAMDEELKTKKLIITKDENYQEKENEFAIIILK